MNDVRTIFLIGRSGRGKSTLANVITGAENKFRESGGVSVSETKKIQVEKFEENGFTYHIIDTPGIGDTKMSDNEVLDIIDEAVCLVKDGLSQVLFVVDGRFDQYEMATYNLLRTIIFDENITKHTTIVRTRFDEFRSEKKHQEDINLMIGKGGELAEIIESCQRRIVHVNNPPIEIKDANEDELNINKREREKSRKKLLDHLEKNCQENYKFISSAQKWLDEKYSLEEKGKKTWLDISNKNLEGSLYLSEFTNLETIICSKNKLTKLHLSKCEKLVSLDCSNNELQNLPFLKHNKNLKNLEIQNNKNIPLQSFQTFASLKKLDISNCSFEGNLKPLKELSKLEELHITNTNLSEGLEYLPSNCKKLYCNSDYQYKSTRIMEELDKSRCSEEEKDWKGNITGKYYNLNKWREDKQNEMIVSIIPLERLFVIRGNIRQFLKKWGINKDKNNLNEISKLNSPEELDKNWWTNRWTIYATQSIGRGSAVAGAILTFRDYSGIGGGILGVYPIAELVASKLEENLKNKENKWKEFLADADIFLDNYNELLGIMAPFEIGKLRKGDVSKALKGLNEKAKEFLKLYDTDNNEEVDVEEIKTKRKVFSDDVNKEKDSKVQEIVNSIKKLEEAIINHRKSSYHQINEEVKEATNDQQEEIRANEQETTTEEQIESELDNNSSSPILNNQKVSKGKNSLFTDNFRFAKLKRRKDNKSLEQEYELQNQEQETHQNVANSSSKPNFVVQIPPK